MLIVERFGDLVVKVGGIGGHTVGQVRIFGVVPDGFHRIEVGSVRRQLLDDQPVHVLLVQLPNGCAVDAVAVTD